MRIVNIVSSMLLLAAIPAAATAQHGGIFLEDCEIISGTNLNRLEQIVSLEMPGQPVNLAWTSDGHQLMASGTFGVRDYDLRENRVRGVFDNDNPEMRTRIALNPVNGMMAMTVGENAVRLWYPDTGDEYGEVHTGDAAVWSLAFSPDGKALASGVSDGTIWLWQLETQQVQDVLTPRFMNPFDAGVPVWDLEFSSDGHLLAGAPLVLWDIETITEYKLPLELTWTAFDVTFSPDGRLLAAVHVMSKEQGIWLFDVDREEKANAPLTDAFLQSIAFSPDGTLLAIGFESGYLTIEPLVNSQSARFPGWSTTAHNDTLDSLAFHPEGRLLASASSRGRTISLWAICE